jgi:hypothetical protein
MFKQLMRIGLTAAMLVALVAGIGAVPASAGVLPGMPTCSTSNLVGHYTSGGAGVAELDLYWDATHHTNCVKMVHVGAAYGHAAPTSVEIWACQGDVAGQPCNPINDSQQPPYYGSDSGSYTSYAGPASVTGAGHCIFAKGILVWGGTERIISTAPNGQTSHC